MNLFSSHRITVGYFDRYYTYLDILKLFLHLRIVKKNMYILLNLTFRQNSANTKIIMTYLRLVTSTPLKPGRPDKSVVN